jgi:RHS repeat-associated protein
MGSRGGAAYLGKDVLGSVRSVSGEYGTLEDRYEYDAFGKPYKGDLDNGMNLGYTGKPYDSATGMYNYGYRDYKPEVARFTTVDPVRDGANWFAYVNNDPVNYVDPFGLVCRVSDYLERGAELIVEGAKEILQGSFLEGLGQSPFISNGDELFTQGQKSVSDGVKNIAEGVQLVTIGIVLSDKTLTDKHDNLDNYESPLEGYDQAKLDFAIINPSNVKTYPTVAGETIIGYLLDGTTISVRDHSSGSSDNKPTLEIYDPASETSIKIRY